jgi:hypothetical protein
MESCGGPAPAPAATGKASRRKAEEDSSPEAADQKADETVAKAVHQKTDADASCDFEDGPDDDQVIRNFNKMGRMKLFTPEFIEDLKKEHRIHTALCLKHYEDVLKEEEEKRNDAAAAAESSS